MLKTIENAQSARPGGLISPFFNRPNVLVTVYEDCIYCIVLISKMSLNTFHFRIKFTCLRPKVQVTLTIKFDV